MATPIPPNRAKFSLREIARAVSSVNPIASDCSIEGITTDSRADVAGKLFVALPGERFDGHDYLQRVAQNGARAVLVERAPAHALPIPVIKVDSTLRALGEIARQHRQHWGGLLIAIAGSAGKTTTRVACQALFESVRPGRVHGTQGNLNNQIGVPMTLLGLTDTHEVAVIEVGTNAPGEVGRLGELCEPNLALLTLIGLEHSEGLGDLDCIEREEGEIYKALLNGGVAIGNGDDARVTHQMTEGASRARRITFGCSNVVDYSVSHRLAENLDRTVIDIQRSQKVGGGHVTFESALLGMPGALAATAAVAAFESLGARVEPAHVAAAFGREQLGEDGRLRVVKLEGDIVVLDDSYNANPPSMTSSLAVAVSIAQRRSSRLVAVLGEMRELGPFSEREHRLLGSRLGGVALLATVGDEAKALHESAGVAGVPSEYFDDADAAAERLVSLLLPGDVVLIKGSRGVRLETVVQRLVSQKGFAA
jgi:UDP-N-acetylmuramoyl-tripeptide--D-alanyl-D-alanine ligase